MSPAGWRTPGKREPATVEPGASAEPEDPSKGISIIDTLTTKQRAYLKTLAHSLKPVHQIGKEGVTDRTVRALLEAFNRREVLKVKVQDSAPAGARETGEKLEARLGNTHLVQVIGHTLVLYRADPDDPEIELP